MRARSRGRCCHPARSRATRGPRRGPGRAPAHRVRGPRPAGDLRSTPSSDPPVDAVDRQAALARHRRARGPRALLGRPRAGAARLDQGAARVPPAPRVVLVDQVAAGDSGRRGDRATPSRPTGWSNSVRRRWMTLSPSFGMASRGRHVESVPLPPRGLALACWRTPFRWRMLGREGQTTSR